MVRLFKVAFIVILINNLWNSSSGQNLIPNPGFEFKYDCPTGGFYQLGLCKEWRNPAGTVDYFHMCDSNVIENEFNYFGNQRPHIGEGCVGLFFFTQNYIYPGDDYYNREYLQTKLLTSLLKDSV